MGNSSPFHLTMFVDKASGIVASRPHKQNIFTVMSSLSESNYRDYETIERRMV